MPGSRRPGKSRCSVASSIARSATLRSGTGARPMPTRTRSVHASAAPAAATDDSLKQSSQSHSSSRCSSAATASGRSASGGRVGTSTTPREGGVMRVAPRAAGSPSSSRGARTASRGPTRSTAGGCRTRGCAGRRGGRPRWRTRRGNHAASSSWSADLPTRIGGLDQMRSNRTSAGMPSGGRTRTPSSPSASALRRVSSSARSLTSTAYTVAAGERSASVRATGPQPHPRSRKVPAGGGGGASSSRTAVPLSRPPGEKTPGATSTSRSRPASRTRSRRRSSALAGAAVK